MASTFSDLKIELIATGEQSGTWGTTTNTNLGTAIEQAITGSGNVAFSSADVTLTLTDTNASQTARNLRLNLTGTSGGARNLIVPAIEKQYIINNGLADTVTVKNSTGTGVAIPAGKTMVVFNDATNVVDVTTYASSLTLGASLPVSSGGTGQTTYTDGQLLIGNSTGNTLTKSTLTAGSGVTISNGNGSITISATGSGGDVTGPASSTDNAFARFDSTTGKVIQNSVGATLDDAGAPTFTGTINVSGTTSSAADLRLYEDTDNGTNYVALKAPALLASNLSLVLPSADGTANQAVVTDGSGNLSFASVAAAGIATNFTALQTFSGSTSVLASKFVNALEAVTVSATAATGTINYDATTQSVLYYTSNAAANWTVNFRASSGTSLDTAMATGESITVAFLVTQGGTPYYNSAVQVDGNAVTPKWQGGASPSSGNASSIDAYVYTIVKTGAATFTVFASQTQFA